MLTASIQLDRDNFQLRAELEVHAGEVSVLFGPSGCGKTTLIRALAGLEECVGKISLNGTDWQESESNFLLPTFKRAVGMVFQNGNLFSHLSVEENLKYGQKSDDPELLNHLIELLDLEALLGKSTSQLSGGEEQRVALGRALLSNPSLLLLDEPLSAQDVARKEGIIPYLSLIKREWNIPIIYITHNIEELHLLADKLLLMEEGSLVASGSVTELLTNPELPLALRKDAGAIVECEFESHNQEQQLTLLRLNGQVLRLPIVDQDLAGSLKLRIAARDVSLALEPNTQSSVLNQLQATVESMSPASPGQTLVVLKLGEQKLLSLLSSYSATQLNLTAGKQVYAMIKGVAIL